MRKPSQTDFTTAKGAYGYAVSLLARREYSRKALYSRLIEKGTPSEIAMAVLDELRDSGYQNDERFIQSLVRVRVSQGKGPIILFHEAREHEIPIDRLHAAIEAESPDWFDLAVQVLEKRFGGLAETWKEKAHQYRFLTMRGFEREHIQAALRKCVYTSS
ncbi:MAG: regulatory protein RecX [Gammaproteobacteria bacterium]